MANVNSLEFIIISWKVCCSCCYSHHTHAFSSSTVTFLLVSSSPGVMWLTCSSRSAQTAQQLALKGLHAALLVCAASFCVSLLLSRLGVEFSGCACLTECYERHPPLLLFQLTHAGHRSSRQGQQRAGQALPPTSASLVFSLNSLMQVITALLFRSLMHVIAAHVKDGNEQDKLCHPPLLLFFSLSSHSCR